MTKATFATLIEVMQNSLPDLFDAQPELLFQLVTMLNPSVQQENNVPVYSVLQIRSYAPDLAQTIAGPILTSNNSKFRGECASLLGLHSHNAGSIEDSLKKRLISVIECNDIVPQSMREAALLHFQDDCFDNKRIPKVNWLCVTGSITYATPDMQIFNQARAAGKEVFDVIDRKST